MEAEVFLLLFLCTTQISTQIISINEEFGDKITVEDLTSIRYIKMHEEITPPFVLGYFENTGTPHTLTFRDPDADANTALGLEITESTETPGLWIMTIHNRQDYESSYFQDIEKSYFFMLSFGSTLESVRLNIININDYNPLVSSNQPSCPIEENTDEISDCTYTITDTDGYMTDMILTLGDYDNVFEFDYERITDVNVKTMTVTIKPKVHLDYEQMTLYIMQLTVSDSPIVSDDVRLSGSTNIVVAVQDMPDTDPVWIKIIAAEEFDEMTPQEFQVTARDGDIGINDDIVYFKDDAWDKYISIEESTGIITVLPIDRDADNEIIYTFTVSACEVNDPEACISQSITFLVTDLNNKVPVITVESPTTITIPENTFSDLNTIISANDMDMGENAMYDITITSNDEQHLAFTVAPSTGYQNSNIYMYIVDYTLLDFDRDEKWREFTLTLRTQDIPYPQNRDERVFTIILENINDEVPVFIFDEEGDDAYVAHVLETIEMKEFIRTVLAEDDDIDDEVRYSLLGTYINSILTIDERTGEITTIVDGAFDYESQEEVVLQVQAIDTFGSTFNTAIAQLTIKVTDVNDETPRITVGTGGIEIAENQVHDTKILNAERNYLMATDDDQTALLEFEIDWDNSYATKNGRPIEDDVFERYKKCLIISTVSITSTGKGQSAVAELTINEVVPENTPDFELFDILYIEVVAIDRNQEVNDPQSTVILPISILDENDVAPVFTQSTIDSYKAVNEEVEDGTTIAIIIATDEDSDLIYYSIAAVLPEHEGLVSINPLLGELYVSGRIDADETKLYSMNFTVTASDGELPTTDTIVINVNDINDNTPVFVSPTENEDILLPEKSLDGTLVTTFQATDADRDEPNNVVNYRFSSSIDLELINYFRVSGSDLNVYTMDASYVLDRDNQRPGITNTIRIAAYDGNNLITDSRSIDTTFTVTLTDINDNAPVIQTLTFTVYENLKENEDIGIIRATDADQAGTNNARITFEIIDIYENGESKAPPEEDPMFILADINTDEGTCTLKAGVSLETYHGSYSVVIKASDLGNPQQSEQYTIIVTVEKYNFHAPLFIYPEEGMTLYLRQNPTPNTILLDYNGDQIPDITATDQQNEKYDIIFDIPDSEVFGINRAGWSSGELRVLSNPTLKEYDIRITAVPSNAVNTLTGIMDLHIQFLDMTEQPAFERTTQTITFKENTTDQTGTFLNASYTYFPDDLAHLYPIYYVIVGAETSPFEIRDTLVNQIYLDEELDREEQATHTVRIQASRVSDGTANGEYLDLTVELLDINDNPPHFDQLEYIEKISTTTSAGSSILQVHATDADILDVLTYGMGEYYNIPTVISNNNPFTIDPDDGTITSNVEIPQTGDGFFLFSVIVNDTEHVNNATVHIYLVSDAHRVDFIFRNDIATVTTAQNQIRLILQSHFSYDVIIEQISRNTDDNGNAMDDETVVQVYFVNSNINQAVSKGTIEESANDITTFSTLFDRFAEFDLSLARFFENEDTVENTEEMLKAWLIGVSIVLGALCILLLVIFILKTRSLTKRLNKLSVIRYGSQDSGLNRKVAPTTNKHAIEGSNPAYSEEKVRSPENDDAMSVGSGDSDLVGVENNPEFDYNYEANSKNLGTSKDLP